jgi:hypothetical protein
MASVPMVDSLARDPGHLEALPAQVVRIPCNISFDITLWKANVVGGPIQFLHPWRSPSTVVNTIFLHGPTGGET